MYRFFSSYMTAVILIVVYAVLLGAATFIEKYFGTGVARAMIYNAPIFFLLNLVLIVNFIVLALKYRYLQNRRWALMVSHVALIVILAGATVTFFFSYEGMLHIREGEKSNVLAIRGEDHNITVRNLPFTVELLDFKLSRYPGSNSPSFYESDVVVHTDEGESRERIYMNNVLNIGPYRIYQTSYDKDEKGTVLLVNHDVAGRTVTYTGYALLLLGLLLTIFSRRSRFALLCRSLKAMPLLLLFLGPMPAEAQDIASYLKNGRISEQHAGEFGKLYMQSDNGRIIPVNTFSSEVLRKLYKETEIEGMNPDQFLLSLFAMPDVWMQIPFIANSNGEISETFGLSEDYCSFMEAFNSDGSYKFQSRIEEIYKKSPSDRTRFDKDMMKLDEKMNIFNQLVNAQRLSIFPCPGAENYKWYAPGDDLSVYSGRDSMFVSYSFMWYLDEIRNSIKSGNWSEPDRVLGMIRTYQNAKAEGVELSEDRIKAEYLYNKINIFRYCRMGYLIFGGILLVLSISLILGAGPGIRKTFNILSVPVILFFVLHTAGIAARWYIGGYAPWSNSYETMVYVAWTALLAGLVFVRRSPVTFALASLLGGVILFVSGLNWMDPQINPLVPVLKSPWLMFHVAVIVASYGFLGICALIGLTDLVLMCFPSKEKFGHKLKELSVINEISMWIGLTLLIIGTFLGAVWANESWGRYWGWDPKETWALITVLVYVAVTHLHLVKKWYSLWLFNLLSVYAFFSILMTFFGVNYFLSGMHSYGNHDGIGGIPIYLSALGVIVLISIFSYRENKKTLK